MQLFGSLKMPFRMINITIAHFLILETITTKAATNKAYFVWHKQQKECLLRSTDYRYFNWHNFKTMENIEYLEHLQANDTP